MAGMDSGVDRKRRPVSKERAAKQGRFNRTNAKKKPKN